MRALPSPSQEATVRRIALEEGVNPDVLVSIWEQESSKSVDPALTGPVLPQGHKYAGAYGQGPFQIMSFHGEMPNDFEAQARWAARHLKQKGVRGYYGKTAGGGSATPTGMPGFPSTDSYEQQVMARVPGAGMLAQAGTPDVPQGLLSQAQSISPPVRQQEENMDTQGSGGGLLSNPWLLIGASILANNDSKNTGKVLGKGLLGGTAAWQAMKQQQLIEQQRQMQIDMARREQAARQQLMEYIMGGGGAQGAAGMPTAGGMGGLDPQRLLTGAAIGALSGVEGSGTLGTVGAALMPYGATTQAQSNEERDRQFQRDRQQARDKWEMGEAASGQGAAGLPPKVATEYNRATMEKNIDFMLAERKQGRVSGALSSIGAVTNARKALDEGMFTGPFAETRTALDKYLSPFIDTKKLTNTQQYIAATAELARQALKDIGGNDSNTDLLFSRATTGGDITMQAEALSRLLEATEKKSRDYLGDYNKFADSLPESQRGLYRVEVPAEYGRQKTESGGVTHRWENGRLVPVR